MKKIKNIGKVLSKDQQKAIKGGDVICGNGPGPCMSNGQFNGYCQSDWTGFGCRCSLTGAYCPPQ